MSQESETVYSPKTAPDPTGSFKPALLGGEGGTSRTEEYAVAGLLGVLLILRILNAYNFRFDSDEPQHLHVVWAWINGLLPYRDIFDNHAPLFHILCGPLLRFLGERPDILIPMRLAMIPLTIGSLWFIYQLGLRLWSKRVGLWAAVLAGFWPNFFHTATEFRTDDLWMFLWFACVFVFISGPFSVRRMAVFGLLLGATFAVSLKTSLLLLTFCVAAAVVVGFRFARRNHPPCPQLDWLLWVRGWAVAGLCALLIPGAVVAFFAAHYALGPMYYCIVEHNVVPGLKRWKYIWLHTAIFVGLAPCIIMIAAAIFRSSPQSRRSGRTLLFLASAFYIVTLYCFWPDLTREDALPFVPLAVLVCTPLVLGLCEKVARLFPRLSRSFLLASLVILEILGISWMNKPWHNYNAAEIGKVANILRLASPGEFVMDAKSGAIFRPRPFYYVLEIITKARMKMHSLKDSIPEDLVATKTSVVDLSGFASKGRGFEFIQANYVPLLKRDCVRVPGKIFPDNPGDGTREFEIKIPGQYALLNQSGPVGGFIDGNAVAGDFFLNAGHHVVQAPESHGPYCVFWQRAALAGFSPFQSTVTVAD